MLLKEELIKFIETIGNEKIIKLIYDFALGVSNIKGPAR